MNVPMFYRCINGITMVRIDAIIGMSTYETGNMVANTWRSNTLYTIHLYGASVSVSQGDFVELAKLLEQRVGVV